MRKESWPAPGVWEGVGVSRVVLSLVTRSGPVAHHHIRTETLRPVWVPDAPAGPSPLQLLAYSCAPQHCVRGHRSEFKSGCCGETQIALPQVPEAEPRGLDGEIDLRGSAPTISVAALRDTPASAPHLSHTVCTMWSVWCLCVCVAHVIHVYSMLWCCVEYICEQGSVLHDVWCVGFVYVYPKCKWGTCMYMQTIHTTHVYVVHVHSACMSQYKLAGI